MLLNVWERRRGEDVGKHKPYYIVWGLLCDETEGGFTLILTSIASRVFFYSFRNSDRSQDR